MARGDRRVGPAAAASAQYGFSPYASGTRRLTGTMGLPPSGMDCCPCQMNAEDYRVYPQLNVRRAGPRMLGAAGVACAQKPRGGG